MAPLLPRLVALRPSLTIPAAEAYVSSEEHVFVERTTLHYYHREADAKWATMTVGTAARRCPLESLSLNRYASSEAHVTSVRVRVGGAAAERVLARQVHGSAETWAFGTPALFVGEADARVSVALELELNFDRTPVPSFSCDSLTLYCARVS